MKIKVLITSIFIFSSTSIFAASLDENVSAILKDRISSSPSQKQCIADSKAGDCSKVIDASKGIVVSEVKSTDYEVSGLISGTSFSGAKISRSFVMQKSNLSFSYDN